MTKVFFLLEFLIKTIFSDERLSNSHSTSSISRDIPKFPYGKIKKHKNSDLTSTTTTTTSLTASGKPRKRSQRKKNNLI